MQNYQKGIEGKKERNRHEGHFGHFTPKMWINTTDTTIFHILIDQEEEEEREQRRGAREPRGGEVVVSRWRGKRGELLCCLLLCFCVHCWRVVLADMVVWWWRGGVWELGRTARPVRQEERRQHVVLPSPSPSPSLDS
ncbi:hypothetical protein Sjap_003873 [Stephania japonica]|uniref:Uncharacterized protein n=1 Tax=Stephania japonica TaxID=461633 RepID=A0AAP0KR59_9MAGN